MRRHQRHLHRVERAEGARVAARRLRTRGAERVRVRLRVGLGIGLGLGFVTFRVEMRSAEVGRPGGRCRRVLGRGGGVGAGAPRTWHSLSVAYSLRAMLSDAYVCWMDLAPRTDWAQLRCRCKPGSGSGSGAGAGAESELLSDA